MPGHQHHAGIPVFVLEKHSLRAVGDLLEAFGECRPCPPFVEQIHGCDLFGALERQPKLDRLFHGQIGIFPAGLVFDLERDLSQPAAILALFRHLDVEAVF